PKSALIDPIGDLERRSLGFVRGSRHIDLKIRSDEKEIRIHLVRVHASEGRRMRNAVGSHECAGHQLAQYGDNRDRTHCRDANENRPLHLEARPAFVWVEIAEKPASPFPANVVSNPPRMIAPQMPARSNAPHPVARAAAPCYNNFIPLGAATPTRHGGPNMIK